jgi:hypothetical protein
MTGPVESQHVRLHVLEDEPEKLTHSEGGSSRARQSNPRTRERGSNGDIPPLALRSSPPAETIHTNHVPLRYKPAWKRTSHVINLFQEQNPQYFRFGPGGALSPTSFHRPHTPPVADLAASWRDMSLQVSSFLIQFQLYAHHHFLFWR